VHRSGCTTKSNKNLLENWRTEFDSTFSEEQKAHIKSLEKKKNQILLNKEKAWRLKSKALWLHAGDENTKFFHHCANGRKNGNTIWNIRKEDGSLAFSFEEFASEGVSFFKSLYKEERRALIDAILQSIQYFPKFTNEEDNENLMAKVSKEELL
jgi:hypothetical protein